MLVKVLKTCFVDGALRVVHTPSGEFDWSGEPASAGKYLTPVGTPGTPRGKPALLRAGKGKGTADAAGTTPEGTDAAGATSEDTGADGLV